MEAPRVGGSRQLDLGYETRARRCQENLELLKTTIAQIVYWRGVHQPEQLAYTYLDEHDRLASWTYGELLARAAAMARRLERLGAMGERTLVLLPSGLDYLAAFYGCLLARTVAVPLDLSSDRLERLWPRIRAVVADCGARFAITTQRCLEQAGSLLRDEPAFAEIEWIAAATLSDERDVDSLESLAPAEISPDELAYLQYTSGSTSRPKGVTLAHRNVVHNLAVLERTLSNDTSSRMVSWLPLFHDMGLVYGIMLPMFTGFPCRFMSPAAFIRRPLRWLQAISDERATCSAAPNFAYELCLRKVTDEDLPSLDLSSWTYAANAAEPVRPETLRRFVDRFSACGLRSGDLGPAYGLAECTLIVAGSRPGVEPKVVELDRQALEVRRAAEPARPDRPSRELVSCGAPAEGMVVRVVDPASFEVCEEGRVGEIWVAGDSVALGYWSAPEATTSVFGARIAGSDGPFCRTGDLGLFLEGELYVTGRIKDLIIIHGQNHDPQDLEWTATRSHEALHGSMAAAFSFDRNGVERVAVVQEVRGDLPKALYLEIIEAIRGAVASQDEIDLHVVALIAKGSLPRTSSGKIQRFEAKRRLLGGRLASVAEWWTEREVGQRPEDVEGPGPEDRPGAEEERETRLWSYLTSSLGQVIELPQGTGIEPGTRLLSLHLDSIHALELIERWNEELGLDLEPIDLLECGTLAEVVELLRTAEETCVPGGGGGRLKRPGDTAGVALEPGRDAAARFEPFPLSDIQHAYWVGRESSLGLGRCSCYVYWELDSSDLDPERLSRAWQRMLERHDMLRAIVREDGTQQVLEELPEHEIPVEDLSSAEPGRVEARLAELREQLSHAVLPSDQWPLWVVRYTRLPGGTIRLHLGFDLLAADLHSLRIILDEWLHIYQEPALLLPPLEITFRDYRLHEADKRSGAALEADRAYWLERIQGFPGPPELPIRRGTEAESKARFVRRARVLPPETWSALRRRAEAAGVTPSGVLLAAYAEVLGAWSKSPRFALNVTLFNREPVHPQVMDLVGDFTSVSLLEVDLPAGAPFVERARSLTGRLWTDLGHRRFSGVQVIRELSARGGGLSSYQAPVVFTSGLMEGEGRGVALGRLGELAYGISQTPQVWLDHQVLEHENGVLLQWDALEALFPEGMLDDMFAAYTTLLEELASDQSTWYEVGRDWLPHAQAERRRAYNDTARDLPAGLLHRLVLERAEQQPERLALIDGPTRMTYGELSRRVHHLAAELARFDLSAGEPVALVMEKGWAQVVAAVGTLLAGGAYVPIDATWPRARIEGLLADTATRVVLTQSSLRGRLEWIDERMRIEVDRLDQAGAPSVPGPGYRQAPSIDDLAYIIFTSGSTGKPKGVMIDHRGAVNTIRDMNSRFEVGPDDRALAISSLSFDLSVWDIFGVLGAGGVVVLPEESGRKDPGAWLELVREHQVTLWSSVPALMQMLVEYCLGGRRQGLGSLRLALLSGVWIPLDLPRRLRSLADPIDIISLGGATEASIWSICYPIGEVDPSWPSIPYGRPLANQHFYVLDSTLAERPDWVPGQLYIGGVGVAKGYWKDPEKTAASFIVHPRTRQRLYRAGDMGRHLPTGVIEFLGREDLQVKVGGYRIELGEIESALREHPEVREAIVLAWGEAGQDRRLAGYVIARDGEDLPVADLRAFLRQRIPEYMVPQVFRFLERFPVTANGKVDRGSLPDPFAAHERSAGPAAGGRPVPSGSAVGLDASDPTVGRILKAVGEVLKQHLEPADLDRSLLELGANSLDLVKIAGIIEDAVGVRPKLQDFLRLSNLRSVLEHVRAQGPPVAGPAVAVLRDAVLRDAGQEIEGGLEVILDQEERDAFRAARHGLRSAGAGSAADMIDLLEDPDQEAWQGAMLQRRSWREFGREPIPAARLAGLLTALKQIEHQGKPKLWYGSAGSLYPVQAYLYAKPGRIQGLDGGVYYYHPARHGLTPVSVPARIPGEIFTQANRDIFGAAAFALFLFARMDAILPMYGEMSRDLCLIEAGLISQLLEMVAPRHQLGLCQIGRCELAEVRSAFDLEEHDIYLHCLLGGATTGATTGTATAPESAGPHEADGEYEEGEL